MPSQIVVWNNTSIQVISTRSGHVLRTLAPDTGAVHRMPQASATQDGTVYFDQAIGSTGQEPYHPPPVARIFSDSILGGTPAFVADGYDPAVSPNGRFLAYVIETDNFNGPEGVVVMDRSTGTTTTWQYSTPLPDIDTISWSPDSKSLVVAAEVQGSPDWLTGRLWLSDPTSRSLDSLQQIQLPSCPALTHWTPSDATKEMIWAGYLNSSDGIGICLHGGPTVKAQNDLTQPVIVDLATGQVVRTLPVLHGLVIQEPGGTFKADASGHHVVFIGIENGGFVGDLYRWTIAGNGQQLHPVLVKNDVDSASWVPTGTP